MVKQTLATIRLRLSRLQMKLRQPKVLRTRRMKPRPLIRHQTKTATNARVGQGA